MKDWQNIELKRFQNELDETEIDFIFRQSMVIIAIAMFLVMCGCGTRYIVVQSDSAGVLISPVKGAKVMFQDADGKPTPGTADLPAGTLIRTAKQGAPK